jgi:hypothetical protein
MKEYEYDYNKISTIQKKSLEKSDVRAKQDTKKVCFCEQGYSKLASVLTL